MEIFFFGTNIQFFIDLCLQLMKTKIFPSEGFFFEIFLFRKLYLYVWSQVCHSLKYPQIILGCLAYCGQKYCTALRSKISLQSNRKFLFHNCLILDAQQRNARFGGKKPDSIFIFCSGIFPPNVTVA